jgi:hypothetical protein
MAVFWVVAPCTLVEVYQCFRGACYLRHQGNDDEGSKHLWNISKLLPDYMVQQPRRQSYSFLDERFLRLKRKHRFLLAYTLSHNTDLFMN